jgi:CheY-like chemotaxis protein
MRAVQPPVHSVSPNRVLIADPDDAVRAGYKTELQHIGCDVLEASDGRDALAKALVQKPTLVITEAYLPMLDGFALCEILRRDAATRSVPILVVTTEVRPTELNRIRQAGADATLVKPTLPGAMVHAMERLITHADRRQEAPADKRSVTAPRERSVNLITSPTGVLSKSHARYTTLTPPTPPPELVCPSCDGALRYERSQVGGVSERHAEQWDYYVCAGSSCGAFQYRQRTRKLRHVGDEG